MSNINLGSTWTSEDDKMLTSIVLDTLAEGKTRVFAFDKASSVMGRTYASVAYRWNTKLNRENKNAVVKAADQGRVSKKKEAPKFKIATPKTKKENNKLHLADVVSYIKGIERENKNLIKENSRLKKELTFS